MDTLPHSLSNPPSHDKPGFRDLHASTIWFTGLSGSGKSTLAAMLAEEMRKRKLPVVLLDGDEVRKTLSRDLGYTKEERDTHITRVADVAHLITGNNVYAIACVIAPTKKIREYARAQIKNFVEVYCECPLEKCEERDVKGHYKSARKGVIKDFVGISVPYEKPDNPEITIPTADMSPEESLHHLLNSLEDLRVIPKR
ncbi:adenylyl-sulfate kinase [Candidatus Woesearchaeota archaeon]|nr:adenylyl-sulfate kinase [Candidatus Woesearchaeota archaeon]